jgi:RNA polymerase sigma-70 factor (ECF subfamily)
MVDRFDTTRWSLVLDAGGEGAVAGAALETLCRTYRPPVLAYVRAWRRGREDAEDLSQAFFAHLLEHRLAAHADRERGRFRAFLLTSLKNFLASEHARATRQRRGSGVAAVSLEYAEPIDEAGPEQAFEREWAQTVLREAMQRLEHEAAKAGKQALFAELRPYLLELPEATTYNEIGERLALRPNTLAVAVHRLRARLQELVREVVADTAVDSDDADSELRRMRQTRRTGG